MKILHLAPIGHYPEGISSVLIKIVPEQVRLGHEVRVASVYRNSFINQLEVLYIDSIDLFKKLITEFAPDVVHFHGVYKREYIQFYKILLRKKIPYLVQMHGALSEYNYGKNHLKKLIANTLFFNGFFKNAGALVFLSESEHRRCVVAKLNSKAIIIPNGCDCIDGLHLNRKPGSILDIVYIGRISYVEKGFDVLLEAIHLLRDQGIKDFFISVYGNPNDNDLALLLKHLKDVENFVGYQGGLYGADKDKRLRQCDCFILPSKSEGMSMAVMEALSYGIPCLLSIGTNMAESIDGHSAGWKFESSPESIKEAIIKAKREYSDNPFFFRNNALNYSKMFYWPDIARESIESYKCLIEKR